jgi:hypothetical protein
MNSRRRILDPPGFTGQVRAGSGTPSILDILPPDNCDRRTIRLNEGKRTQERHIELTGDGKTGLIVPGV